VATSVCSWLFCGCDDDVCEVRPGLDKWDDARGGEADEEADGSDDEADAELDVEAEAETEVDNVGLTAAETELEAAAGLELSNEGGCSFADTGAVVLLGKLVRGQRAGSSSSSSSFAWVFSSFLAVSPFSGAVSEVSSGVCSTATVHDHAIFTLIAGRAEMSR
jgi:hypothetical protein